MVSGQLITTAFNGAIRASGRVEADRRLRPRVWDGDFLLLRQMASAYRSLIAKYVASTPSKAVLDFGCGSMPYRELFEPFAARYMGADFEGGADSPEICIGVDGTLPLPDACVDVVLSSQVLEHVLDVRQYLGECRRVLRDDGVLFLSTHGSWLYHPHPADLYRWTRFGLQVEVERGGFAVRDLVPCLGPLAYTTQVRLLLLQGFLGKLGASGELLGRSVCMLTQCWMWLQDKITPSWVAADNSAVYVLVAEKRTGGAA